MTRKIGTAKIARNKQNSTRVWHLVTNHLNMLYMLAAGVVMSPAGFRGKYYSDALNISPGWIPLFNDKIKIPDDVLEHVTAERKHLLPCIASFNLSTMSGPVRVLSRDRSIRHGASITARKRKDDLGVQIQAPLPMSFLVSINFRSREDLQAFKNAANDVSNVDLSHRQLAVSDTLFATDTEIAWLPGPIQEETEDVPDRFPAFGQALGGALGMLYHIANRSDLGLAVFRSVTSGARVEHGDPTQIDPILAELPKWIHKNEISGQADTRPRLFWGIVKSLVTTQGDAPRQTPVDVALKYLESQLETIPEPKFKPRLERLIADMHACLGLGSGTITELFERHKGSLSRPLLLFCLRENCLDLLRFSHPLLKDSEYILAGILFGVRDGWLQFPRELRDPDMSAYVDFRVANADHWSPSDTSMLTSPPRPKPLREFFTSSDDKSSSEITDIALEIAKKCDWNDCIETWITLAESDYPRVFERKGLQVMLPGRVVNSSEQMDMASFLCHLAKWPSVEAQIKTEVRGILSRAQEVKD